MNKKYMDDSITVFFEYVAFLYLAEAVLTTPSPRNYFWDVFKLAVGTFWNDQSTNCKMFTTTVQNSAVPAADLAAFRAT